MPIDNPKEPWQMTRQEWLNYSEQQTKAAGFEWRPESPAQMGKQHQRQVEGAIYAGLSVPPEVLADYPELLPPKGEEESQVREIARREIKRLGESNG